MYTPSPCIPHAASSTSTDYNSSTCSLKQRKYILKLLLYCNCIFIIHKLPVHCVCVFVPHGEQPNAQVNGSMEVFQTQKRSTGWILVEPILTNPFPQHAHVHKILCGSYYLIIM